MSYFTRGLMTVAATSALLAPAAFAEDWNVEVFGRLNVDYTIASADQADLDVSSSELRRARIGGEASQGPLKVKLELEADDDGNVSVTDGYADWKATDNWSFRIGQHRTPNSLDEQTSSRFSTTIERSAFTDSFGFDRLLGVSATTKGDNWAFTAGAYAANVNDTATEEGYTLAARLVGTAEIGEGKILHLGGSVRHREKGDDQGLIRYRQRAYQRGTGRIVSTGGFAESDTFVGGEAALMYNEKRGWVAGEYAIMNADGPAGSGDLTGGYVEAGYFFGGSKGYKLGKFDRPTVDNPITENGGRGALAISARFDTLDLTDAPTDGGSLDTLILGLDWYPTKHTRLVLNAFQSDASFGNSTSGLDSEFATLLTAGADGDEVTGVVMRFGFDF